MSATESNLYSVGYDMVVGLTQNSLNSTMERYLSTLPNNELEPSCYLYTDPSATDVKSISYSDLLDLTCGVDPFTIPTTTTNDPNADPDDVAAVNTLASVLFAYGFKATMGLPNTNNLPDIITLQDGTQYQQVIYNMYFADFNIVQLQPGFGYMTLTNTAQTASDPWIYQYEVNLNLQSTEYSSSDSEIPSEVLNLSNASMFSIQQLLLDLTVAPVISANPPAVYTEFDANPEFQQYLQSYFNCLRDNEATVFSTAIQPLDDSSTSSPSLVPTALDFMVSRYTSDPNDGGLTEEQTQGLWTLNYLIMANNNTLPNPAVDPSPTWNWLDANEDQNYSGVMTIGKAIFVNYLKETLDPALYDVCIYPDIEITDDKDIKTNNWYHESNPAYTKENTTNNQTLVLSHSYNSPTMSDEASADWYKAEISTKVTSNVYLNGNTIEIDTQITAYTTFYAGYLWGDDSLSKTHGYVYAKQNKMVYTLSTNPDGKLQVTEDTDASGNTNLLGTSGYGEPDPSVWSKFLSGGNESDWATSLTSELDTAIDGYLNSYDSHLTNLLNNANAWVYPGADTFTYSKSTFSDYQDLTSYVKYTDVS